ncbi:MAG: Xaa-Pro aminopeptidase, partial [Thermomicrobiales bacterium]|nr:Xaa-Pro aminopeptidase [Thermomicrobiales bacterium]
LRSPGARVIANGDAITTGIGFWGGLCCRAGVMTEAPDETYRATMIEPYFRAIATWWSTVRIGVTGGELVDAVTAAIGDAPWQPFVNPGHVTSYDEWVVSFSLAGNQVPVASGMAMQCDIIPAPLPPSRAINCEDSLAIADEALRDELAAGYPEVWARIQARRALMTDQLGLTLHPEVLPLSVAPAYLAPCWLSPETVCVIA